MAKSSKTIVNQRVLEIIEMLINGKSRISIVHYGSTNWSVGERQIDKYIAKARAIIQDEVVKNLEYDYAKAIKRYENLYQHALEEKDYRLALSVNKEITSLQGLNKIQIQHTGNIEFISNIPD